MTQVKSRSRRGGQSARGPIGTPDTPLIKKDNITRTPAQRIAALIAMAEAANTHMPLAKTVAFTKQMLVRDAATLDALIDDWEANGRDRRGK